VFAFLFMACSESKPPLLKPNLITIAELNETTLLKIGSGAAAYDAVIEYGAPDSIKDNDGPLFAYIRFPTAGETTDETIAWWAKSVYKEAQAQLDELIKKDSNAWGEINIHFDSYFVQNRYAGIIEDGMLRFSDNNTKTRVVKTFNIDTETGEFLANSDILDFSKLSDDFRFTQESLEHIAISRDGLIVVHDNIRTTIPYEELGDALILGGEPEPPTPAPEPVTPTVLEFPTPFHDDIDPTKPMIALTFDDGPSAFTLQILDIFEEHGGRGTFCVIGNLVNSGSGIVTRAHEEGHEIIGHSWSHRDLSVMSLKEIKKDLSDTANAIEAVTGVSPRLFRPPFGKVSETLKKASGEIGLSIINWSVDPVDWKYRDSDFVYEHIMSHVHDNAIILSHDVYGSTVEAMERVIPELIEQGYQLVTVSELLYYSGVTVNAGVEYRRG
jgi:peptidoglycan/xylan/chitin deacetylase (PgdA/CDA1 family)